MATQDKVIEWLQDAHAMEVSIQDVLENHAKDAAGSKEIETRYRDHLRETREHAESLKTCLEANGEKASGGKSFVGDLLGKVQAISTGMYDDEIVKNCLSDYATEHFEIACYKSLIAAAQRASMTDVAAVCQSILAEEEEMADWVDRQIPLLTEQYLDQQEEKQQEDPGRRAAGG